MIRKSSPKKARLNLEHISRNATKWIGSIESLIFHTALFIGVISLPLFGINFDTVLLVLTTIVSLEAIYLAIFIQMTVNRNTAQLHEVEKDIEDIQEDVEEISEDIEDIQEDVEEISEDMEEIQKDVEEISEDIEDIQEEEEKNEPPRQAKKEDSLATLEATLAELLKEVREMKKLNKKE